MTTLDFKDELTENPFSYGNVFMYTGERKSFNLYFSSNSDNYPFILKSGLLENNELQYTIGGQLRNRILNTKKIKEVIDSARIPLYFRIKDNSYLMGKGFLARYNMYSETYQLLFVACIDDSRATTSIEQVKFFVSRELHTDLHKALQPAIKDFVNGHPGDVVLCNNILDYIGDRFSMPRGGTIDSHIKYQRAVVRATLAQVLDYESNTSGVEELPQEVDEVSTNSDPNLPF